jgi:short-subunit dehydrogenase
MPDYDDPSRRAHVVITGASGGIGRALAWEFARGGCAVTLVGRRRAMLEEVARGADGPVHIACADLSDLQSASTWIHQAEAALGPIDVLINNAGSVLAGSFTRFDPNEMLALIQLDLVVPLALMRAVLPDMLARRSGVLVNIASTGALAPAPGMVAYCAAKSGLAAASESLRGELRGTGVDVVTVYPGPIPTAMLEAAHAGYPASRWVTSLPTGTAEELARRVRRAVERRAARVVYPSIYGMFRHLPALARRLVDRFTPPPLVRDTASRIAPRDKLDESTDESRRG